MIKKLVDDAGRQLDGIYGLACVSGKLTGDYESIGLDMITMDSNASFELHTHPGAHILYILQGRGVVFIGGKEEELKRETAVFIPADQPHAVAADNEGLVFLAFGYPHHPIDSKGRMKIVKQRS